MKTILPDDTSLLIFLISYHLPTASKERFYFMQMSTLQATTLIDRNRKIKEINLVAYDREYNYVESGISSQFGSIGAFNDFFLEQPEYFLHDCEIILDGGLMLRTHDDGEVSLEIDIDGLDMAIVEKMFKKYQLDISLIDILRKHPGYYFHLDEIMNIKEAYKSFDDYVNSR
jgi:hypothetical protein